LSLFFLFLDLLLESINASFGFLDGFVSFALIFSFFAFFFERRDLFLELSVVLLEKSVKLVSLLFEGLNLIHSYLVWHKGIDSYKFSEFHILHIVLGILVYVELVEVAQKDVL